MMKEPLFLFYVKLLSQLQSFWVLTLLELASPDTAETVSGRKIFRTAAMSADRQILGKHFAIGSNRRTASRFIPTKSAKPTSWPRGGLLTNISQWNFQIIFGTKLLWRSLENMEGKSQWLTMSCRPLNETAKRLKSKRIETSIYEFWQLWNWNWSWVVVTKPTRTNKKTAQEEIKRTANKRETQKVEKHAPVPLVTHVNNILSSTFLILTFTSTIIKPRDLMDCMYKKLSCPTISRYPFPYIREFCTAEALVKQKFLMIGWRHPSLIHFSQRESNCLVDPMATCFMLNLELTFSPIRIGKTKIWKKVTTSQNQT